MAALDLQEELAPVMRELQAIRAELAALAGRAPGDVLSTEQAAALAGVTPKTVRAWVQAGTLRAQHRGRRLVIRRAELEAHLAGAPQPAAGLLATLTPRGG